MKCRYCIISLFVVFCLIISQTIVLSQENRTVIDSLKQQLKTPLNDSLHIVVLQQLLKRGDNEKSQVIIEYVEEGLKIYEAHPSAFFPRGKMSLLTSAGIAYQKMADYPKALSCYIEALRIVERLEPKRPSAHATILNCIGTYYLTLKQNEKGKSYIKQAIDIALNNNLHKQASGYYNNLGMATKNEGDMDQAIFFYQKAIQYSDNVVSPYSNLGVAYFLLKRYKEAEYYFRKTLMLSQNDVYSQAISYSNLGSLYTEMNRFKEAEDCFHTAERIADTSGMGTLYEELYESIIPMYEKQNDYKNMSLYQKKLMVLKDSIYKETSIRQMNEMQAKYDLDTKSREIQLLNKDKEIAESNADKERLLRNFMLAASLFALVTGIFIMRNALLKQKVKHKALSERNALIEKDNLKLLHENTISRYEVLKSKISPHFLFNSLYTLTSIVLRDQNAAVEYIERFSELYRMILKTDHKKTISLQEEMDLVHHYLYLQKMRFGEKLMVNVNIQVDTSLYIIPPFAIQMMVENAIKHNTITRLHKLTINIYTDEQNIFVVNNLQKKQAEATSTFTGQRSIVERYALITATQKPVFFETETEYIVKLPLVEEYQYVSA